MFEKVAISNRSEVAVRIIRACQELGLKTVLLHSEVDQNTLAYRLADEKICIGGAYAQDSYLDIEKNVKAILGAGAEAVHPGFGFLSESAEFRKALEKENITFIGPSVSVLETFSDKTQAKKVAERVGIPTLEGYKGEDQSLETLTKEAEAIGYPLMIKASLGGGGRGMRIVSSSSEMKENLTSAKREALAGFGSDHVFLEKYLPQARHIEVQIFVDITAEVYTLGVRACSVQRNHQKVIEEAGEITISEEILQTLYEKSRLLAREVSYEGAGTVEFLVQGDKYYFLEVNTRLQVEHPVTEMVWGVDLVKAQILTAQKQVLSWSLSQKPPQPRGHSIECRIYAQDPYNKNIASVGDFLELELPHGPHRRFEVGYGVNDSMTAYYDPLICKVIVWDETRFRAIEKMRCTLKDVIIFGVKTNIPLLQEVLSHPHFVESENLTVRFLGENFENGLDQTLNPSFVLRQDVEEKILNLYENSNLDGFDETKDNSYKEGSLKTPNPWFGFKK